MLLVRSPFNIMENKLEERKQMQPPLLWVVKLQDTIFVLRFIRSTLNYYIFFNFNIFFRIINRLFLQVVNRCFGLYYIFFALQRIYFQSAFCARSTTFHLKYSYLPNTLSTDSLCVFMPTIIH